MRIMIVDPGFDYSTLAVAEGYYKAFIRLGYEVIEYDTLKALGIIKRGLGNSKEININQITEMTCAPIVSQVMADNIDAVLVVHGFYMNPLIISCLRSLGCKVGLILTDDPMQVDIAEKMWSIPYEYVFTNDRNCVKNYGDKGHYLPVAVDEEIFKPKEVNFKFKSDILIGGSFYRERVAFIEEQGFVEFLEKYDTCLVGSRKIKFNYPALERMSRGNKVSYEEMSHYVSGTKVCIDIPKDEYNDTVFGNTNSRKIKASCLSPRIFECFASKVLCLTNTDRSDTVSLFPNLPVPMWVDRKDLIDVIRSYLNNEKHGYYSELKNELHDFTIKNHTYLQRVQKIQEIMNLYPSKKNIRDDGYVNINVNKRWQETWYSNFNTLKQSGCYTPERSLDCCRTSVAQNNVWVADIIANGPSLENLPVVFDCERRVRFYLNEAIKLAEKFQWDKGYAVVIHPDNTVYDRCFKDGDFTGHHLIASTLACPDVINKWINEKYGNVYFFNTGNEGGIKQEVFDYTKYPVLRSGFTVGFSALAMAVYLGFKKINIYGLDFCYMNNKRYAYNDLDLSGLDKRTLCIVEDKKKRPVFTDGVLLKSRDIVLKLIKHNPEVEFRSYGDGLLFSSNLSNLKSG